MRHVVPFPIECVVPRVSRPSAIRALSSGQIDEYISDDNQFRGPKVDHRFSLGVRRIDRRLITLSARDREGVAVRGRTRGALEADTAGPIVISRFVKWGKKKKIAKCWDREYIGKEGKSRRIRFPPRLPYGRLPSLKGGREGRRSSRLECHSSSRIRELTLEGS